MSRNKDVGFHIVRYGTVADQKFLVNQFRKTYDQLVLNANIISHMPSAIAALMTQKLKNKPYFIDPLTHAFQHDISFLKSPKKDEIKSSIKKLLKDYGNPAYDKIIKKSSSLVPADFKNVPISRKFCESVINFQLEKIPKEVEKSDTAKYFKFLELEGKGTIPQFKPSFVIAPYFFLEKESFPEWLGVNIKLARFSEKIAKKKNIPLGVEIVLSRDLLVNKEVVGKILSEYGSLTCPSLFLIWIDNFSEQSADAEELSAYIELVNKLGRKSQVINLFGSFYSIALAKLKITPSVKGIAHGLGYGENRQVIPVGGGIPIAKYYFPRLHNRLQFRYALRAVRAFKGIKSKETFQRVICDCKICQKIIQNSPEDDFKQFNVTFIKNGREYPTTETKDICTAHYLFSKQKEYKQKLENMELEEKLLKTQEILKNTLDWEKISHCSRWKNIIAKNNSS